MQGGRGVKKVTKYACILIQYSLILKLEAMESCAFPDKIISISTEILQKYSKLFFCSLESFESYSLYILD